MRTRSRLLAAALACGGSPRGVGEHARDPSSCATLAAVKSDATSVEGYLASLPAERRAAIGAVRDAVLAQLPTGFEEVMQYGMISYVVPLRRYPGTYNGQPLAVASLANQKNHMALYLMGVYGDDDARQWLRERWTATGRKLDMGKSCVRFKRLDDVPLDLVGEAIARTSVEDFIARYERSRR
jgi:hypothetical protein